MAAGQLTRAVDRDPGVTRVIDGYLRRLADRMSADEPLTTDMIAEMREDLLQATAARWDGATDPSAAAEAAVREFGDEDTVASEWRPELGARHAHRTGVALMVTGPLVGAAWLLAVLLSASPGRWLLVLVAPVIVIGAAATGLTVVSSGRLSRLLPARSEFARRAARIARGAACVGDALLLAGCAVLWSHLAARSSVLVIVAVAASLTRLSILARAARHAGVAGRRLDPPRAA